VQGVQNATHHSVWILDDFVVFEAQDVQPCRPEEGVPGVLARGRREVRRAISLQHQTRLYAKEIRVQRAHRVLPAKLGSAESATAYKFPQRTLRGCRVAPQPARSKRRWPKDTHRSARTAPRTSPPHLPHHATADPACTIEVARMAAPRVHARTAPLYVPSQLPPSPSGRRGGRGGEGNDPDAPRKLAGSSRETSTHHLQDSLAALPTPEPQTAVRSTNAHAQRRRHADAPYTPLPTLRLPWLRYEDGMPTTCALNFDHLTVVQRSRLGGTLTALRPERWPEVQAALLVACGFQPRAA